MYTQSKSTTVRMVYRAYRNLLDVVKCNLYKWNQRCRWEMTDAWADKNEIDGRKLWKVVWIIYTTFPSRKVHAWNDWRMNWCLGNAINCILSFTRLGHWMDWWLTLWKNKVMTNACASNSAKNQSFGIQYFAWNSGWIRGEYGYNLGSIKYLNFQKYLDTIASRKRFLFAVKHAIHEHLRNS